MKRENSPSLLWPRLAAIVLVFVFLSGISEVACIAAYAHQNKYSIISESLKPFTKSKQDLQKAAETAAMPVYSQSVDKADASLYETDQADM